MRPGRGLLRLLSLLVLLAAAAALVPPLLGVWAIATLGVAAGLLAARLRLAAATAPTVSRRVPRTLPLGAVTEVSLRVTNPGARALRLVVTDHPPEGAAVDGLPVTLTVPARSFADLTYQLTPGRRGDLAFEEADVLLDGAFDLWQRRVRAGAREDVRVVPNVRAVARFALFAVEDRLGRIGIMKGQQRGEGTDFRELREYRDGDSLRRIDWKATSRRNQLVSREYQDEKDQRVICLVDCGRRLHARDGTLSHFDHVLNSVLLLAYVALRQGDSVGLQTFSGRDRWLPPVKGASGLEAILGQVYDLETTTLPSDYLEAATTLMKRQRRRALVVLVSNVRDEDSEELKEALRLLRTRHLVLLASLRETALDEALAKPPETLDEALRVASAHRYLAARRAAFDSVRERGTIAVD
ncbi:MAG: DUF58 domain-containing protein, partial [Acidobacteria bacterium]|nr:DUF58 domain-containing protein [Acidobacteriota bacterium]